MKKIGVIGSQDFCTGFRLAGVQNMFSAKGEEYREKIGELEEESEFGIVITNQEQFQNLKEEKKKQLKTSVSPIFVVLSEEGVDETLRKKVKESVGVDLLR